MAVSTWFDALWHFMPLHVSHYYFHIVLLFNRYSSMHVLHTVLYDVKNHNFL